MTGSSEFDLTLTRQQTLLAGIPLSAPCGLAGRAGAAETTSAGGIAAGLIASVVGAVIGTLGVAARKARRQVRPRPARGTAQGRGCHHGAALIVGGVS